jgi:threonylcarbamoyladenosine tRNA methylthiotransferase MtaB
VNQYETQHVQEVLEANGYREAVDDEPADLCVVNTCTVTSQGDAKSRQLIRKLARDNPQTRIVVMGCYATRDPAAVAGLPSVAEVVTDKREIPDVLGRFGVVDVPAGISRFRGRHRAYVKVQDGCVLNCTFCIIPQVRPGLRSRPADEIEAELRRLVDNGYREIVLTGIHLGHYGVDLSRGLPRRRWCRLGRLVERLCRVPGRWRLRLSSLEATEVTDELIGVMADQPKVCPHLHLSLQSGSDAVLERMKRRYRIGRFLERVERLRGVLDRPAFTTDVIVGFPGETDEEFQATCRAAQEAGFSKIHIFPFSPRRGTPAAEMTGQVPADVKHDRRRRLAELESRLARGYHQGLLGRPLEVLAETPARSPGTVRGTACRYVPVEFPASAARIGELVEVSATRLGPEGILAETLSGDGRGVSV